MYVLIEIFICSNMSKSSIFKASKGYTHKPYDNSILDNSCNFCLIVTTCLLPSIFVQPNCSRTLVPVAMKVKLKTYEKLGVKNSPEDYTRENMEIFLDGITVIAVYKKRDAITRSILLANNGVLHLLVVIISVTGALLIS